MKRSSVPGSARALLVAALLSACSSRTGTTGGAVGADAAPAPVQAPTQPSVLVPAPDFATIPRPDAGTVLPPGRHALVVGFLSIGGGTDREAEARLEQLVKELSPAPARTRRGMGMEGEHNECFVLDGLSPETKQRFIERVAREVGSSRLVHIGFAEACRK